jgi:predicted ATPase
VDEQTGFRALDRLARTRFLRQENGKNQYTFSHDTLRTAVYTAAGAAQRRTYHRRALAILEEAPAPPAELARQALAGELAGPAIRYSIAAGDAALEVLAPREAIKHYEQARELVEAGAPEAERANLSCQQLTRLYAHLGRAYELVQDRGQARGVYETLRHLARKRRAPQMYLIALLRLGLLAWRASQVEGQKTPPPVISTKGTPVPGTGRNP